MDRDVINQSSITISIDFDLTNTAKSGQTGIKRRKSSTSMVPVWFPVLVPLRYEFPRGKDRPG